MRSRVGRWWLGAALLSLLPGCATTTETDPMKLKAGDLIGPGQKRLGEHLASRRQVLGALQARASDLETQLMLDLGKLHRIETSRAAAGQNEAEARAQLLAVAEQRKKAEAMLEQIAEARLRLEKARAEKAATQAEAIERELAQQKALEAEIQRLESEVAIISDSIRRTLRLREEQMLRES